MSSRQRRSSPHDLVTFDRPPVGEVALTTQFAWETVDLEVLAGFASAVKADLPDRQQQPAMPAIQELFDVPKQQPQFEISFEPPNALPRTWLLSRDGSRLVQLQADRISLNWRRLEDETKYPRYTNLRKDFRRYFDTLRQCIADAGREMPDINICEVTYVNPIEVPAKPHGDGHPELAEVLNRIRPRPRGAFLPHAEDTQFHARWRIPGTEIDVADRPAGRLYVAAQPGLKPPTSKPIYMVTVTGRLLPKAGGEREAWAAMDVAHRWVVLGFKDVTTGKMHKTWGLDEGG